MRHRPTINHQTSPHPKSWRTANLTKRRMCRGEIFFARPCAVDAPSPNHQPSPHPKSWRPPNVTTRRICTGEIFFAPTCTNNIHSPNHQTSPHHKSWRLPDVTIRRMCRGEIYFARPRLIRNYPHVVIARPLPGAAPRMYGRKIFRPYVHQQYPFTQPSNIATP